MWEMYLLEWVFILMILLICINSGILIIVLVDRVVGLLLVFVVLFFRFGLVLMIFSLMKFGGVMEIGWLFYRVMIYFVWFSNYLVLLLIVFVLVDSCLKVLLFMKC